MKSIEIGDLLFHNSDKPVSTFDCTRENFVCFGLNLESISQVGGSGYTSTFEVIDSLGTQGNYGDRLNWGIRGDWVSIPCETARDSLQLINIDQERED